MRVYGAREFDIDDWRQLPVGCELISYFCLFVSFLSIPFQWMQFRNQQMRLDHNWVPCQRAGNKRSPLPVKFILLITLTVLLLGLTQEYVRIFNSFIIAKHREQD